MSKKHMLVLAAAGVAAFAFTACTSEQDVKPPEDPQSQEWSKSIKESYPDWQPTQTTPQGNQKYDEVFTQKVEEPAPAAELQPAAQGQAPAAVAAAVPQGPSRVRLDVTADGKISMDGVLIDDVQLKAGVLDKYLTSIATAYPGKSTAIIHPLSSKAPQDKLNLLLDACRKCKIANVSYVPAGRVEPSGAARANARPTSASRVKVVVDPSQPSHTYVVQSGDTLSRIAQKEYKNGSLWYIIYNANKGTIKNSNKLKLGTKLQIPAVKVQESGK